MALLHPRRRTPPDLQRLSSGRHYYIFDALGSVVALTDQTAAISRRYSYDPYGNTLTTSSGSTDNPFRFAAEHQGAASLYKIGMRYYDPTTGRWTQQDPLNRVDDIQISNRYIYVGGNPVNLTDPTGLIGISDEDVLGLVEVVAGQAPLPVR